MHLPRATKSSIPQNKAPTGLSTNSFTSHGEKNKFRNKST